jgi:CRP-like cAMP-binding protein
MTRPLQFLTRDDETLLRKRGTKLRYSPGDAIIRAGTPVTGLCVVWEGRVRMELNDRTGEAALVRIDPAHIFGEDALLGDQRARISVVAEDEVQADVVDGRVIRELVAAYPEFGTRLFRALASALFERLSRMAERAAPPFP